jgi:sarcosine oxidase, subunit gamma
MAETLLPRRGPLEGCRSAVVRPRERALCFSFRGSEIARTKLGAAFGVVPNAEACRAAVAGERAALWLGPDEWLLLAPDGNAEGLNRALTEALGDAPHSLVDVSHRNTGFIIEGDGAADLLNEGCPLDLDPTAFPIGACTRTVLAKSEIVLWRKAPAEFQLECWRSFAPYIRMFLSQAAENTR